MHLAFGAGVIGTTVRQLDAEKSKVDVAGNPDPRSRAWLATLPHMNERSFMV